VYAQLYIFDTDNEIQNRVSIFDRDRDCDDNNGVDKKIVVGLVAMFDEANELVKSFRVARDLLAQSNCQSLRFRLLHDRPKSGPRYNAPIGSEIAALIVRDFFEEKKNPDIILSNYIEMTHYGSLNAILVTCNVYTSSCATSPS
jgi:hypothetical protein